ncbi:MAG TPA: gliding motility-associated C-terminal domain-containing protein, partial [Cytophagaceae bacterium]|nr:gliding motility-associated C-terminal domain-containing protein [Cytophagaceae bacterium]
GINLDPGSDRSIIKGNIVGSDINGTAHMGNGGIGIVFKSDSGIIGSTIPGEGNVIVDSKGIANLGGGVIDTTGCGILLANANANVVKGNLIGVGADGTTQLPNIWDGINISVENLGQNASNNIIQRNVIAYNLNNGISVGRSVIPTNVYNTEVNNDLRFNSIFCNKKLGIYLELNKPTDWGNKGQVAPVINNALSTSSKIVGIANINLANDSVDIYEMIDCPNCDLNPQGKTYIATVIPDAAGNWSYDHGSPITGTFIATATDAQKNTSQFSLCFTPCQATAVVSPTTFTVQLEMNSSVPLTLTSSSSFSPINPTPGKIFWSLNTPDTTGTAVFSTATSVNFNFSVAGGTGDHGPGLYTVYLIAKQSGCMDTTEAKLNVFFIPNIVTPNGDHHNDQWAVGNTPGQFDAKIYNRWGDLVYSKSDYTNEWNGDGLSDGVYYYLLEDKTQSKKSFKGWVQIMK